MSALSVQVPFPVFQGRDGQPLDNGYVWIGQQNLNPQTNPVLAYFDLALTIPAAQPLRTINGYISNAGTPAQVYVDGVNFSILVQDSKGSLVYSFPDGSGISTDASGITYLPGGTGAVATTVQAKLRQTISVLDFGTAPLTTAQFQNAVTAAAGGTLIVNAEVTIDAEVTVPAGTVVEAVNGGYFTCVGSARVKFTDHVSVYSWWWGDDLTDVPIQHMLDSLNLANGGVANIAAGSYIITTGITAFGINNLTIAGAGQDLTVLTGTFPTMQRSSNPNNGIESWGVISIDALSFTGSAVNNIIVTGLTTVFNGGTVEPSNIKNFYFGWCINITFEKVTIRDSKYEALAATGPFGNEPSYITITNCQFFDSGHDALNLNTGQLSNVIITNNFFKDCAFGIQVVGHNIVIADNVFIGCGTGILVAEANYIPPVLSTDCYAVTVTGNVIQNLGLIANNATRDCFGIHVVGGDSQADDGTVSNGFLIANNVVNNTVKAGVNTGAIVAFAISGGNVTLSDNKVSGLSIQNSLSGNCEAYRITAGNTRPLLTFRQQCYINNNTLDNVNDALNIYGYKWFQGFTVRGRTGSDYYFSDNVILGVASGGLALGVVPQDSGTPNIYINGDILNGYIYYPSPGKWFAPGGNPNLNIGNILDNTPLFGASTGSIITPTSTGITLSTFTDNSATPSVVGYNVFYASNSSATTITDFTGGVTGQQITISFTNSNTTINDTATIYVAGTFTSAANAILRLVCIDAVWYETSRSLN